MKKLKLFFACLLMAVLSIGQVWGDPAAVGTTLFSEDFSGYAKDAVPSGSVTTATGRVVYGGANVTYSVTNGGGTTKIYTENSAGGTSPEILVGKSNGTLTIAGIPSGGAKAITVSYKQNKQKLKVESTTTGYSGSKDEKPSSVGANSVDITIADGSAETFTLVFTCTGSSNVRVDDILVTVKTAGEGAAPVTPTCATPTFDPEDGETFTDDIDVEIAAESGTTIYYTINGNDPTTSSSVYSSALNFTETTTLKAMAVKEGSNNSAVATATYTKVVPFAGSILEIVKGDFNTTSYDANNGDHEKSGITFTTNKVYQSGSSIQFQKTNGLLYNKTDLGEIAKIEITTYTGKANNLVVYSGTTENPTSGAVTGSTSGSVTTYTFAAGKGFFAIKCNSTGASNVDPIKVYYTSSASSVAKPTISGDENFVTSTTVTISHDDADHIYYTTNGVDPTTSSAEYTAPFTVDADGTTTVKAIAVKGSDVSGVATQTFTKATVLSVAEARAAIDAGGDLSNKYVAGIISQIDSYNSTYHSITYWISDDGTTTDQLEVYSGLAGVVKEQFASKDDLAVGDDVTVKGTLKKYSSTYEFDYNNTIVAYKPIARLSWSETSYNADIDDPTSNVYPTLTNTFDVTVAYSSNNTSAATIDPATGEISLVAVGSTTITASFAGNSTYKANSASYTLNVASSVVHATISFDVDGGDAIAALTDRSALPSELPVATKAGKNFGGWFTDTEKTIAAVPGAAITEDITLHAKWLDPYTVAEAKTVIDANPSGIENQYVAGIISQIDSYNNTYKSITYWISADGTTTNQLQVYSGLIGNAATPLGKEAFSAKEDLELGDEVVVTGTLKLHNSSVYEFDKNNTIYTFSRKASAGLEYAVTAVNKVVGDADFVNPLTNPNSVDVTYETSDDQVAEVANDGTVTIVGEGTATITASFAGNATYKAAVVSYTLTVSATVDTRHIANSPATFTTTNGNLDPADIAYASYQGGSNTAPAIYNDGIRLYQISGSNDFGGFVTITAKAGCTIDEVQITTTNKYATTVAYSKDGNENLLKSESVAASSSYTTGTGLNVSSVNILNLGTGSSGRLEIASIKVYYTGEPATIDHYELGGTYQTAFMQNEDFNHTGLIVYAVYDALGENKEDITSMCTFSEPDMSTTGDKTIEITYNEAVVISYTINVAADSRKVAESPATFTTVSGDMTPNDITFASNQGGAGTAPQNYNDGIRLYQAPSADAIGGFITLKAKKGCTIDQVKITTTNTYATTVAYSVDGNENLLGSESVAKSSDYSTPSGLNVESVNIVNKGTGSSGRLEIASIKVWYTGDPLAVDHYILGGTYATEFEQYGTFSYEGLTVTAAYDAGETITEAVTGFTVEADLSTAGNKKAEVMLNSVKIAEYDITVTASAKEDPALAYIPASVVLTLGDALSAPTFSNTHNVSPISYNSDKPAVATVDPEGNIALAGGCGTAVITASFAGDEDYIESEAIFTITVNEPAEDLSGTWVVATSVAVGDRIIVGATVSEVTKTMGGQNTNNRAAVTSTLADGVLTPAEGTKTFLVVDAGDGKFALQALNGKYLTSATSGTSNNLLEAADYDLDNAKWTISIEEGVASIVAAAGSKTVMQYNSGSTIFSCYGSASQKPVKIFKRDAAPTPVYETVRSGLTAGNYYTICYPKAMTDIQGATLWSFVGKDANFAYIEQETATTIEAGKPYIMYATASTVTAVLGDETNAPGANGAIHGTFSDLTQDQLNTYATVAGNDLYLVIGNELRRATGEGTGSNTLPAQRAFVVLGDIPAAPAHMPAHVRRMPMQTDQAQGFENIEASEKPMKLMIDGQMYILRGEKVYDATGRLVK